MEIEIRTVVPGGPGGGRGEGCVSGWRAPREPGARKCYNLISYWMVAWTDMHTWRSTL